MTFQSCPIPLPKPYLFGIYNQVEKIFPLLVSGSYSMHMHLGKSPAAVAANTFHMRGLPLQERFSHLPQKTIPLFQRISASFPQLPSLSQISPSGHITLGITSPSLTPNPLLPFNPFEICHGFDSRHQLFIFGFRFFVLIKLPPDYLHRMTILFYNYFTLNINLFSFAYDFAYEPFSP